MAFKKIFGRLSASPTRPKKPTKARAFDVNDLLDGPFSEAQQVPDETLPLDEKLRQAYYWIVTT